MCIVHESFGSAQNSCLVTCHMYELPNACDYLYLSVHHCQMNKSRGVMQAVAVHVSLFSCSFWSEDVCGIIEVAACFLACAFCQADSE